VVCQTGKRSAMGTQILKKAGIEQTANVEGGILRWRELGLPTTTR
jgi:rhodanese-related sulfurtransferase